MHIWVIADLHLSFGVSNKKMDLFGPLWERQPERVEEAWRSSVQPEDLVLIPGDISWATHLDQAIPDLEWIEALPGQKLMIKGNHDFWWSSLSKIRKVLPPSVAVLQNEAVSWNDLSIGGTRLWDCPSVRFKDEIIFTENPAISKLPRDDEKAVREDQKIYARELQRLELSLKQLDQSANKRIVMTHYPPVNAKMDPSPASELLEAYNVDICVFGHLHNVREDIPLFGERNGVQYKLTSCDYLHCTPLQII